jgi:hypothetical protein
MERSFKWEVEALRLGASETFRGEGTLPQAVDAVASTRAAALVDPEGEGLAKCLGEIESQSARRVAAE